MRLTLLASFLLSTLLLSITTLHAEGFVENTSTQTFKNNTLEFLAATEKKNSKGIKKQKGDVKVPESIWEEIKKSTNVSEGIGLRDVYIFFDPFCGYCHFLWKETRQFSSTTNYWIPVAEMAPESKYLTAALIESGTKEDLQTLMETNLIPPIEPTSEHIQKYEVNASILKRLNIWVYPVVFYSIGDKHYVYRGAPKGNHLKEIFGEN